MKVEGREVVAYTCMNRIQVAYAWRGYFWSIIQPNIFYGNKGSLESV